MNPSQEEKDLFVNILLLNEKPRTRLLSPLEHMDMSDEM